MRRRRDHSARHARAGADDARASNRGAGAGNPAWPPLRQDRRPGAELVRWRAHRRHDAVDGRRRRATADFFRPVSAATAHLRLRAICHLCLHGVVGSAGCWGHARRRIVRIGIAVAGASTESARGDCAAAGIQSVWRRVSRRDAGLAYAQGVWPGSGVWADAGGEGEGAFGWHFLGACGKHIDARHHRSGHGARRGARPLIGGVSCHAWADEHRVAADRADGRHGDLSPVA